MRLVALNVAFYPPARIAKKAIAASRRLAGPDVLFTLSTRDHYPHSTIYMTRFPLRNLGQIEQKLTALTPKIKRVRLRAVEYRQNKRGYVDVRFALSREISRLQQKIIRALNPLREGLIGASDARNFASLTSREKKNVKRYGYRGVGVSFRPHLTFTRLRKAKRGRNIVPLLPKTSFSFWVDRVVLFRAAKHGTARAVVKIFSLGGCPR